MKKAIYLNNIRIITLLTFALSIGALFGCTTVRFHPVSGLTTDPLPILREDQLKGLNIDLNCLKANHVKDPRVLCEQIAKILAKQGAETNALGTEAKSEAPNPDKSQNLRLVIQERELYHQESAFESFLYYLTLTFYPRQERRQYRIDAWLYHPSGRLISKSSTGGLLIFSHGLGYASAQLLHDWLIEEEQANQGSAEEHASRELYGRLTAMILTAKAQLSRNDLPSIRRAL